MIICKVFPSPVGNLTAAVHDDCLVGLWLEGQKHFGSGYPRLSPGEHPVLDQTESWLQAYFLGQRPSPRLLPLAPMGSPFQKAVWEQLLTVPYGETTTYGAIAKAIGCKSAQAVGNAVGRNPISILIPCHRVVGSDGSLTGYAGGIENKIYLLELEKRSNSL